jgi:glycosyltransferase involved in cell wall biosynthesis
MWNEGRKASIRVGYINGHSRRVNERAIDDQWTAYLSEYAETVAIPPYALIKLFGGSVDRWHARYPISLEELAQGLEQLRCKYRIDFLYINLPAFAPYLLLARNFREIRLGFLMLAHCVGSEFWLKLWLGIAPFLTEQDVLLANSATSKEALLRISRRFEHARLIPLCIAVDRQQPLELQSHRPTLLSIGRLERVKNIHTLIECLASIRERIPNVRLVVAGEYTGASKREIEEYQTLLRQAIECHRLEDAVDFVGTVEGDSKQRVFAEADALVNLSTDPGETFGFNLIEAKVWGLPVICTSWDGFRELVKHEVDGFLVDCHWQDAHPVIDQRQVVDYASLLLSDGALRRTLSEHARMRSLTYDYRAVMPRIRNALHDALSARNIKRWQDVVEQLHAPLGELPHLYELHNLRQIIGTEASLLQTLARQSEPEEQSVWLTKVKPIIQHYAGRSTYANL